MAAPPSAGGGLVARTLGTLRSSRKMMLVLVVVIAAVIGGISYFLYRRMQARKLRQEQELDAAASAMYPQPPSGALAGGVSNGGGARPESRPVMPPPAVVNAAVEAQQQQQSTQVYEEDPYIQTDQRMAQDMDMRGGSGGYATHPYDRPVIECRPEREKKVSEEQRKHNERFLAQTESAMALHRQHQAAEQQAKLAAAQPHESRTDHFENNAAAQIARQTQEMDNARREAEHRQAHTMLRSDTADVGRRYTLNDPAHQLPSTANYTQVPPTAMGTHHGNDCLTPAQRLGQGGEYPNAAAQPRVMIKRALEQELQPMETDAGGALLRCTDESRQTASDVVCHNANNPVASVNKGAFGQSGERLNVTGSYTPQLPVGLSS